MLKNRDMSNPKYAIICSVADGASGDPYATPHAPVLRETSSTAVTFSTAKGTTQLKPGGHCGVRNWFHRARCLKRAVARHDTDGQETSLQGKVPMALAQEMEGPSVAETFKD